MRSFITVLVLNLIVVGTAMSQKVGLVLSGGAAKGIAHVGVIKALEEHNIPIDYIVGTSMGSVVGGCYAAGFSAEQIEEVILSDEFQQWVTGEIRNEYNYYFNKDDDTPSWITLGVSVDSLLSPTLNAALVSDLAINFVLTERFSRESLVAKYDFDSLFVPFRAVASDVFTQQVEVLDSGTLGSAIRASLSVPFFYRPIKVNNKYLFDGGIYNNFPVDIMEDEFSPDVVIGSNVSAKVFETYPYHNDDQLIDQALVYIMIDKSEPSKIGEEGIYIQPDLSQFSSLDFRKTKALIDSGYAETIRHIDEIKLKIGKRTSKEDLEKDRAAFLDKRSELQFTDIGLNEFNSKQRRYIRKAFNQKQGRPLSFDEIKKGYYKLVSEDYFSTIYPEIVYNNEQGGFVLHLHGRPRNNLSAQLGGIIASRNVSHVYLGLKYYHFDKYLTKTRLRLYSGNFYKSAGLKSRITLPLSGRIYIEPEVVYNNWDYISANELFLKGRKPTIYDLTDRIYALNIGMPLGARFRLTASGAIINNTNLYSNNDVLNSTDTLDEQKIEGHKVSLSLSANTLNRPQYASLGRAFNITFEYYNLEEHYQPGSTSLITTDVENRYEWYKVSVSFEQYFKWGKHYSMGYLAEAVFSNHLNYTNFKGTIINTPAFNPIQDSRTIIQENLRAFNYTALGIRNIYSLTNKIDVRLEGYIFKPINEISSDISQQPNKESFILEDAVLSGTFGLVYHSPIGPLGVNLNYYDDSDRNIGVFAHFGYFLFNRSSME